MKVVTILILLGCICIGCLDNTSKTKQTNPNKVSNENSVNIQDTIIWIPYSTNIFKRIFYGPVKSSEEVMTYMAKTETGEFIKTNRVY